MRELEEAAPDSLTMQVWKARQAAEDLLLLVCWTWIELLRLDKLLGVRRP